MTCMAREIRFTRIVSRAENSQVFGASIGGHFIRFTTAADNPIKVAARFAFVKESCAFAERDDGGLSEQLSERRLRKQSEQRESF